MILNGPGKISIMVGGQVVGMAKEAKLSFAEDDASTKEFSDPWRTPDIKQSWDISCDAMVRDAGDLRRITKGGPQPTHKIDGVAALIDALYCFDLSEGRIESN